MSSFLWQPKKVYALLAISIVVLFALSAVGNSGTEAENDASNVAWIGAIGWFGFLICLLLVILYSLALLVRRLTHRQTA